MLKKFSTFILLLIVTVAFAQDKPNDYSKRKVSFVKDDYVSSESNLGYYQIVPTLHNPLAPAGTVPFPINYNDYGTNGNNMRKLVVLGDTIIVGQDVNPDITGPPPATTTTRVYYQVSYNGGTTWLTDAINTSPATSNRWANLFPIFVSGSRTLVFCGRIYNNNSTSTQGGLSMVETILGLGSLTNYVVPNVYRDYFGYYKNTTTLGGIVSTPAGSASDSLVYRDFNYVSGTYGPKIVIAPAMDANFRYYSTIASNGQNVFAAWWRSAVPTQAMLVYESVNGGTTWGAPTTIIDGAQIINGDTLVSWFGGDLIYKPNSTVKGMAFSTLGAIGGVGSYGTREGSKILYWNSAGLHVLADFHKYGFMNDTALWNNHALRNQVGITALSHPSLAYSDDGSVLYCAFSAMQKDTSAYATGLNYNFNDIFICKSTDDGNTWSNFKYVTKTLRRDETYPSLSKQGNTATTFNIVYNESGSPGSFTFNDNAPADTTYTVFKKGVVYANLVDVPTATIGINNISSEVPANFKLSQNYPNPFNPTTLIRFSIPKASFVTLKVYDVSGKLIETLVNQTVSVGTQEVSFDASRLSSGIYFYTLEAGNFKETKKMMFIK